MNTLVVEDDKGGVGVVKSSELGLNVADATTVVDDGSLELVVVANVVGVVVVLAMFTIVPS